MNFCESLWNETFTVKCTRTQRRPISITLLITRGRSFGVVQFLTATRSLVSCTTSHTLLVSPANPWIIHGKVSPTSWLAGWLGCSGCQVAIARIRGALFISSRLNARVARENDGTTRKLRALEAVTTRKTRSSSSLDEGDCPTLVPRARGTISNSTKRIPQCSLYGRHDTVDVASRITLSFFRLSPRRLYPFFFYFSFLFLISTKI